MAALIDVSKAWLRVFQLPSYAPDLNPAEGIWSTMNRTALANRAVTNLDELITVMRHGLKQIQYRPDLINGYLPETGLAVQLL
jgi:transposase